MGVAPDVFTGAVGFMRVSFIGIVFVFSYAMFQALMRGVGQTRIPVFIVLGTVLLNFLFDRSSSSVGDPISPHGVMGAALATLATQALASLLGLLVFLGGRHGIHLAWRDRQPDPAYIRKAFLLSLPGSVELSTRGFSLIVMSFFAAGFGTLTTAAYGVGSNVLQVVSIPAMGISMAVSTMVGQNIGAGNTERASRATVLGAVASLAVLTFAGVLAWIFAPYLVRFFVPHDPLVIAEGARFLRIMCLAWGGIGVQLCMVSTFRASGNMVTAMMIALLSQWLIQFPLAYLLSRHTGLHAAGLWWSFPGTNLLGAIGAVAWFARGGWKQGRLTGDMQEAVHVAEETIIEGGVIPVGAMPPSHFDHP